MASELTRRRLSAAGAMGALGGALGYVAGRGYFHLVVGSHGATIVLREARVNFHLALVIAAFVALVVALVSAELARDETRIAALERFLERAALPVLALAIALVFVWP